MSCRAAGEGIDCRAVRALTAGCGWDSGSGEQALLSDARGLEAWLEVGRGLGGALMLYASRDSEPADEEHCCSSRRRLDDRKLVLGTDGRTLQTTHTPCAQENTPEDGKTFGLLHAKYPSRSKK